MTSLVCFEAAARNLSFKAAAAELNGTPAAVSHQIKSLEREIADRLFRRQHRGVELTETGAILFVALQRGFEGISETVAAIRARRPEEEVVIQATTAMSAFWLTPRISGFWQSHPEIVVSQIVSDTGIASESADLVIHYGQMPDDGGDYRVLFHDRIMALGSPTYAGARRIRGVADLLEQPLIHVTAEDRGWTGWADWFAALGHGAPTGRRHPVNNYMIALQMAQDGVGAVLGWDGLVGPLLEGGQLVQLVPETVASPHPFFLKLHPRASHNARVFCDWLEGRPG
ncbi:LysR substrate-binding domain-containing protein [Histidinibacterium lentulum]